MSCTLSGSNSDREKIPLELTVLFKGYDVAAFFHLKKGDLNVLKRTKLQFFLLVAWFPLAESLSVVMPLKLLGILSMYIYMYRHTLFYFTWLLCFADIAFFIN